MEPEGGHGGVVKEEAEVALRGVARLGAEAWRQGLCAAVTGNRGRSLVGGGGGKGETLLSYHECTYHQHLAKEGEKHHWRQECIGRIVIFKVIKVVRLKVLMLNVVSLNLKVTYRLVVRCGITGSVRGSIHRFWFKSPCAYSDEADISAGRGHQT